MGPLDTRSGAGRVRRKSVPGAEGSRPCDGIVRSPSAVATVAVAPTEATVPPLVVAARAADPTPLRVGGVASPRWVVVRRGPVGRATPGTLSVALRGVVAA